MRLLLVELDAIGDAADGPPRALLLIGANIPKGRAWIELPDTWAGDIEADYERGTITFNPPIDGHPPTLPAPPEAYAPKDRKRLKRHTSGTHTPNPQREKDATTDRRSAGKGSK